MDIKIRIQNQNNLPDLEARFSKLEFIVQPVFEYQAIEFATASANIEEFEMPNCYLETKFVKTEHEELDGLVTFNTDTLSIDSNSRFGFDRRRYFTNFNFYQTGENDIVNDLDDSGRFENIVLTSYSTTGGILKNPFYGPGYELGKVFPNKINLKITGLGSSNDSFKGFLNNKNYKYSFIHDVVQQRLEPQSVEAFVNETEQDVKFYLLEDYDDNSDFVLDNHTPLIKNLEPDVDRDNYLFNFLDKINDYNNEVLFVRIQKTYGDGINQNFWIYPDAEGEVKYCDTQVKIDKDYTFQAFIYVLMEQKLYEIPLGGQVVAKVLQPPHPRPQVEFKNIKNKKNQIKIMMNLSSNKYKSLEYKGVNPDEEQTFLNNYSKYDPNELRDSYYQYETETGKYEIFKMERQPTSYYDIGTNADLKEVQSNSSTLLTIVDSIKPFKDYYYMIRSFNHYGYYSNPSPIYKVHMTKDANDTFLHVETVDFFVSDQNKYMLEKTMAKLLQVVPSSYQTTFENQDDDFDGYSGETSSSLLPDLGIVDKKIWDSDTKFKLRLVSRKTGKKIDINLNFKLTKQITQNNQ